MVGFPVVELAPGKHRLEVRGRLNGKKVHSAMEGVFFKLDCAFDLDLETSEEVTLISRFEHGETVHSSYSESRESEQFIYWRSSTDDIEHKVPSKASVQSYDCRRVDLRKTLPPPECD